MTPWMESGTLVSESASVATQPPSRRAIAPRSTSIASISSR